MSKYTTGEVAELCQISVRTVQYYDTRGLLTPSEISEGGRRIYSEDDVRRMKIICFLRQLDLPIDGIKKLLKEEKPENVISLLLDEQEATLKQEIDVAKDRVDKLKDIRQALKTIDSFELDDMADIAYIIERKRNLRKLRTRMLVFGIMADIIEIAAAILWIRSGYWWLFALSVMMSLGGGLFISSIYHRSTVFICPACHAIFRPRFRQSLFARHTPNTRRLTCTHCGHKGFCVETYGKK